MNRDCENAPAVGGQGAKSSGAGSFPDNTRVAVDLHEAQRFLDIPDPGADRWHFRTFADSGSGGGKNLYGTLEEVAVDLQLANGNGCGVFVAVNEGGHKDDDITRIRAVFADFDGTPMPDTFDLDPHLIVESSAGKFHVYWLVDGLDVAAFKATQQAIAARHGSDPSVCNPSRVMRLPGFIHRKGEPFRTRIIHESGEQPYTAEQVLAAFPPASRDTPRQTHTAGAGERVVSEERHGDLLKLAAKFARQVHFDGLGSEAALAALFAEASRGRWTREMPADEIRRAFDGALDKCRRGEWRQADKPDPDAEQEDSQPPAPRLTTVNLTGFMAAVAELVRFVIYPFIPCGVSTLLAAHGGFGKTMLSLIIAAHVACGRSWAGFTVEQGDVVFISLEDRASIVRERLRKIVEAYGLDAALVESHLRIFDGTDVDGALMTEVNDHGTRTLTATPILLEVEAAAEGARLVIIDNASDGFDGDENNRRQVRAFMRRLSSIAKANDAGLMMLAHVDKVAARHGSQGNSYSGSTAWHNSARSRLAMLGDESGCVELVHEKCNFAKLADPVRLAWSESGVLVPSKADPAADGASDDVIANEDAEHVLAVIRAAVSSGQRITTATGGAHTTVHALEAYAEHPKKYHTKAGRKRVRAAIVLLARQQRIQRSEYRDESRNTKAAWEPTELTQPDGVSGEEMTTNVRESYSPIPPSATNAPAKACVSPVNPLTHATHATHADATCPKCDGEGCGYCAEAVL